MAWPLYMDAEIKPNRSLSERGFIILISVITAFNCASAAVFMEANPRLLDPKIMLTHYSAEVLFSPTARQSFVRPDIQSIPEHD